MFASPSKLAEVSDFLKMEGPPEPHHVLLHQGLLHQWVPGMRVTFVSHQWLSETHPDPDGRHAAVLRGTLQGVLDRRSTRNKREGRVRNVMKRGELAAAKDEMWLVAVWDVKLRLENLPDIEAI